MFSYDVTISEDDCDPSGTAASPRVLDMTLEAIDGWFASVLSCDLDALRATRDMATPVVHVSMDFASPIRPGDQIGIRVVLEKAGASTLSFEATGQCGGSMTFEARIACCFVDRDTSRPVAIPDILRERLEAV